MKVRRASTLAAGAAVGAATMWLLDPDSGRPRRRRAAAAAWRRLRNREGAGTAASAAPGPAAAEARRRTQRLAQRAREGFDAARQQQR